MVVFENTEEIRLLTREAIANFLGAWCRWQYDFLYAFLQPPFSMKWYATSGQVRFDFYYLMFMEEGWVVSDGCGFS